MNQLLQDLALQPQLFYWKGPISEEALNDWLARRDISVPRDLRELWIRTGGGDLFETETLLEPFGDPALGDDVDGNNDYLHSRGLPLSWFVFHDGAMMGYTVVDQDSGQILRLPKLDGVPRPIHSIGDWYLELRTVLGDAYGLGVLPGCEKYIWMFELEANSPGHQPAVFGP